MSTVEIDRRVTVNPFPGLRPFRIEESHLFFGREGQTDQVLLKLARQRFVGMVVCRMIDTFGREITRSTFGAGERIKRFETHDLSDGVYILEFETPQEPVSRKQLLVSHGQGK